MVIRISGERRAAPAAPPSGWPTAETTGATGALTPNASQFLGTNGAVYTDQEFTDTGTITVAGDNMTFTNCKFNGEALWSTLDGGTVTNCTFVKKLGVSSSSNVTFLRVKIENFTDDAMHVSADNPPGPPVCSNIIVRDSYIYNSNPAPLAHADGLHVRGSSNFWLDHCYIDMGPEFSELINSAIFFEQENGGNSGILVENCYLRSNGYWTAYLNTGAGTVQNNTFAIGSQAGYFFNDGLGGDAVSDGITGTGNVKEDGSALALHPS